MKFPEYQIISSCLPKGGVTDKVKSILFKIELSPDLVYFDGHFDQMAILPAVAQLHIVKTLAIRYLSIDVLFCAMRQLKFKSPIVPNSALQLALTFDPKTLQLAFVYQEHENIKSKGILLFKDGSSA